MNIDYIVLLLHEQKMEIKLQQLHQSIYKIWFVNVACMMRKTELSNKKQKITMLLNKCNELTESFQNLQQKVIQATSEIEKLTKSHEETVQKMQQRQYHFSKKNKE